MRSTECRDCAAAERDAEHLCMTAGCPDCEVREIARMDVEMRERFFDRAEREAGRDARKFLQTRVWDEADRIAALRNPHRVLRADRGLYE